MTYRNMACGLPLALLMCISGQAAAADFDSTHPGGRNGVALQLPPQAGAYLIHSSALLAMGQHTMQSLQERLGAIDAYGDNAPGSEAFVRAVGGQNQYHSNLTEAQYGFNFDQDWRALQLGSNWRVIDTADHSFRLGVALSSGRSHALPMAIHSVETRAAPVQSRHRTDATAFVGTVTWRQTDGLYVDGMLGGTQYRSDVTSLFRAGRLAELESDDVLASIETGYRWKLGGRVSLEPQLQVWWRELETEVGTDADGIEVSIDRVGLVTWRAGARVVMETRGPGLTQYVKLNYVDNGASAPYTMLSGTVFETGAMGSWAEAGYGMTAKLAGGLNLYGDLSAQAKLGAAGGDGWAVSLGGLWAF